MEEAAAGVAGVMAVGGVEKSSFLLYNRSWAMMATSSTAICAGMWAMSYAVTDAQTFIIPPVSLQVRAAAASRQMKTLGIVQNALTIITTKGPGPIVLHHLRRMLGEELNGSAVLAPPMTRSLEEGLG